MYKIKFEQLPQPSYQKNKNIKTSHESIGKDSNTLLTVDPFQIQVKYQVLLTRQT